MCVQFNQQSQSKLLGHLLVFLPSQCWCATFGELTVINNIIWENKEMGQKWKKKKKQRWVEVSQPFLSETVAIITTHFNIMSNCKTVKLKKNVLNFFYAWAQDCLTNQLSYYEWIRISYGMVMKPVRLLCYMFLLASFYGPDYAQHSIPMILNLLTNNRDTALIYSVTICAQKLRIVHGQGASNIN